MSDPYAFFGLPKLSRKGGFGALCRQIGAHAEVVDRELEKRGAELDGSPAANERWTEACMAAATVGRHARAFLRDYVQWCDSEEERHREAEQPAEEARS